MSNDLNRCEFIGRLGADPDARTLSSGSQVANIRIACGWKTKDNEGTEWVPVVFFGKLAEIVVKYLRKGSRIYVAGRFQTRKWQDQSGNDRYSTEIIASDMQMLDTKGAGSSGGGQQEHRQEPSAGGNPTQSGSGFDDDIPF